MTFNSLSFYVFFILITAVNFLLPAKKRWIWLLIASTTFYCLLDLRFFTVLFLCTLISFTTGLLISKTEQRSRKKVWLWVGLALNVGILILFKYLNFFFSSFNSLLDMSSLQWNIRGIELFYPIGISFYTFQVISYLLDVFSGRSKAENNFARYALYVSFFPQLLIGPIERFNQLNPQLMNPKPFEHQRFVNGLLRVGWGLFKKLIIADRLAVAANTVFAAPYEFSMPQLIIAILAFSFQIYLDFAAYTDIAIGTASILGIDLVENFNKPYLAVSVTDFWRRWHISLSNWLRDYIFIPLNYKHRRKKARKLWISFDILVTFLISGLWHGANWTFVFWGFLNGLYQTIELLTQDWRNKWVKKLKIDRDAFSHKALQILFTFTLVSFSWVFFKADTLREALSIFKSILTLKGITAEQGWLFANGFLGLDKYDFWLMTGALLSFILIELSQTKHNLLELLNKQPTWLRWIVYLILIYSIIIFGFYGDSVAKDFVYFQF